MNSRSSCNLGSKMRANKRAGMPRLCAILCACACILGYAPQSAADAPQWMHALVNAPIPAHDEKTDAVLLYSETNVNVVSADKIKTVVREAYKILRPQGRDRGDIIVFLNSTRKVNSLHGWCIPAQGKDFEVKDKEAMELSPPMIKGAELIDDVKVRVLHIPAPDPGNIVGYEYEVEEHPLMLQREWRFQEEVPVRESRYSLQLPTGWEYKASWLNYPKGEPSPAGSNGFQWVVSNVKALRKEQDMPPVEGLEGQMILSLIPPAGPSLSGFADWQQMGNWYSNLTSGRFDPSPEIKQKALALTSAMPAQLEKMRALARFVQHDIRYVAIELGIGGWQPHPAPDVFTHRYGDCKDKATLMRSMLHEIGVDSYYVIINTERGSITPATPAHNGFNHAITAIKLPDGLTDPSLVAIKEDPKLGRLLFFDPTDDLTPFGQIRGPLQANYGLLVTAQGGQLVELPKQPSAMNGIQRSARLTLDAAGRLQGEVQELRFGDRASLQRYTQQTIAKETERIKPIESLLAGSLANFQVVKASIQNLNQPDQPFGFNYTFVANNYAQNAGNLLLVRPRVFGTKTSGILETKEPRQFPVEFEGPVKDTDSFEITLPSGYVVDELPPPVDVDFGFASYHSKTENKGNVIDYTRTFEVKELSVPVSKAEELKRFYRIIASDERNTVVLKPAK
jgi:Domain of Unknown Function with PDB structure (DUF3857)/Transglutaminase-like superfamily